MTTKDEALKLALEALEVCEQSNYGRNWVWPDTAHPTAMTNVREAITAIRSALAEQPAQQQEPHMAVTVNHKQAFVEGLKPQQQEPVAWRNAALRVGEDLCSVGPFGYYDMTAEQWLDWALSVVTVHAPPAQQQEPVAWMWRCKPYCNWPEWSVSLKRPADSGRDGHKRTEGYEDVPLYTSPPQRKPLTDGQREEIAKKWRGRNWTAGDIIDATEAAHGIKGDA